MNKDSTDFFYAASRVMAVGLVFVSGLGKISGYQENRGLMASKKLISYVALAFVVGLSALPAYATTTQTILSQSDAQKLIHAAEESAQSLKANVCIAVLDQSGMLLAFERMDNAPIGCIDSAILKGRAAVLYRTSTDKYMDRANGKEPAIATLPGLIPLGGGSPVVVDGAVLGAVGASGSANPNEISIAKTAAESFK